MFGRPRDPNAPPPRLKDRIRAMRLVPRLVALVWSTHRGYTLSMIILRFVRSVVPVATLWIAKLIIDDVVTLAQTHGSARNLWMLVALEMAVVVGGELLARASSLIEGLLSDLFTNRISIQIMEHASTLDLNQFEDPKFYDHLERARQGTSGRVALLAQLLGIGQSILTLVSLSVALAAQVPWLLVLLAIAVLPSFLGETHFAALTYSLMFRRTPARRQLDYVRYVGASDETAKEVQLFGLAPWLIARYKTLADRFYEESQSLAIKKAFVSSGLVAARHARLLRRLRDRAGARRRGIDHDRYADVPRGVVSTEPRSDSAIAHVGEQHLRAEPVPEGPVRLLRHDAVDRQSSRCDSGTATDQARLRVSGCRLPLSGQRALGGSPSHVHAATG